MANEDVTELRPQYVSTSVRNEALLNTSDYPFDRFSSFLRLQRVTGYVLRFVRNYSKRPKDRKFGALTLAELRQAQICLLKAAQAQSFSDEIAKLRKGHYSNTSKLSSLTPLLDKDGLMRVGGRLKHSDLPCDKNIQSYCHQSMASLN